LIFKLNKKQAITCRDDVMTNQMNVSLKWLRSEKNQDLQVALSGYLVNKIAFRTKKASKNLSVRCTTMRFGKCTTTTTPIFSIQISNSDYIQYTIYKQNKTINEKTRKIRTK